jgi:hypothetical protein
MLKLFTQSSLDNIKRGWNKSNPYLCTHSNPLYGFDLDLPWATGYNHRPQTIQSDLIRKAVDFYFFSPICSVEESRILKKI